MPLSSLDTPFQPLALLQEKLKAKG